MAKSGGAVRELIARVLYQTDNASYNKVNRSIETLKKNLEKIPTAFSSSMDTALHKVRASFDKTSRSIQNLKRQIDIVNGVKSGGQGNKGGSGHSGGNLNGGTLKLGNISTNSMRVQAGNVFLRGKIADKNSGGMGGHNDNGDNGGSSSKGSKWADRGEQLGERGAKIAAGGAAILAPLAYAVNKAADFEEASSKVQALLTFGKSEEERSKTKARIDAEAKRLGDTTRFSATTAMGAMEKSAMAGWDENQIIASNKYMLNLAVAGSADLIETTDIVTDGMTALHMGAEEAERFTDAMAVAAAKANTNVHMMGETFKYAAGPAGTLGYSIEDLSIATALMANAGIKESQAGTALRSLFTRMSTDQANAAQAMAVLGVEMFEVGENGEKKVKPLRKTIDELRASFKSIDPSKLVETMDMISESGMTKKVKEKLTDMIEKIQSQGGVMDKQDQMKLATLLEGQEGLSGFLAMITADDESYKKITGAMDNKKGAAAEMAKIAGANTKGDLTAAMSALETSAIEIGSLLLPILSDILKAITPVIRSVTQWVQENSQIASTITIIAGAIGSLLVVLGTLGMLISGVISFFGAFAGISGIFTAISGAISAVVSFIGAMITILGGPFVAAIAAVIAILTLIVIYWDEIKAAASACIEWIIAKFLAFLEVARVVYQAIASFLDGILQTAISVVSSLVASFFSGIEQIKSFFSGLYDYAMNILSGIASAIGSFIGEKIAWAREALGSLGNFVASVTGSIGSSVSNAQNSYAQTNNFYNPSPSSVPTIMNANNKFFAPG